MPRGTFPIGPVICTKYEMELAPLDGIGLNDLTMDRLLTQVLATATNATRWHLGLQRNRKGSKLTDEQWWRQAEPALNSAMNSLELPISSRVGRSVANAGDPDGSMRFGIDALIDGILAAQQSHERVRR